jgi:hypothetical protein
MSRRLICGKSSSDAMINGDERLLMADIDLPTEPTLYEADEHLWIEHQIAALRNGNLDRLDRDHLVEYLTEMTIRDRRELTSRFKVLLQHILKCQHQPDRLTPSWRLTIAEQQDEIRDLLDDIPSLGRRTEELLRKAYPRAVKAAAIETGLPASSFPAGPPVTVAEALAFGTPEGI